ERDRSGRKNSAQHAGDLPKVLHPSRRARSLSRRKFNRGFGRENRERARKRNYRSSLQRSGDPKIFGSRLQKKSRMTISNYLFAGSAAPRWRGTWLSLGA